MLTILTIVIRRLVADFDAQQTLHLCPTPSVDINGSFWDYDHTTVLTLRLL